MSPLLLDILHDLRAKKLLPVALVLGLAMVLTPIFLLDSAAGQRPSPMPLPDIGAAGEESGVPPVALEDATARPGSNLTAFGRKDPFRRPTHRTDPEKLQQALGALGEGIAAFAGDAFGEGLATGLTSLGGDVGALGGGGSDPFGSPSASSGGGGSDAPEPSDPTDPRTGDPADPGTPKPPYTPPTEPPRDPTAPADAPDEDDADEDDDNDKDNDDNDVDPDDLDVYAYETDLRITEGSDTDNLEDVDPFSPLPDSENFLAFYTAVDEDEKAVFLISDGVTVVETNGNCQPEGDCEILSLAEGEEAALQEGPDGEPVRVKVTDISFEKQSDGNSSNLRHKDSSDERKTARRPRAAGGGTFSLPSLFRFFAGP